MSLLVQERTYASSSKQWSHKHLGDSVLIIFWEDPFLIHKCSLQRLAAMVNRVQSLVGGSQPPWICIGILFWSVFGVIGDHGRGHTIALEYKEQGLMGIPFALHRVSTCPTKRCSIRLGHFIASSEVQNEMIIMGHQILSCHVPVVRSFFILKKMLLSSWNLPYDHLP